MFLNSKKIQKNKVIEPTLLNYECNINGKDIKRILDVSAGTDISSLIVEWRYINIIIILFFKLKFFFFSNSNNINFKYSKILSINF